MDTTRAPSPHYAAALFEGDDLAVELTPLSIEDAKTDAEADEIAMDRAGKWIHANGLKFAVLQIVKDGVGLPAKRIEAH